MTSIVDLCTYVHGASIRLLVMVDLQMRTYEELAADPACDIARALDNCMSAIRHAVDMRHDLQESVECSGRRSLVARRHGMLKANS